MIRSKFIILVLSVTLYGCAISSNLSHNVTLEDSNEIAIEFYSKQPFDPEAGLNNFAKKDTVTLSRGSKEFTLLTDWLTENKDGWEMYWHTPVAGDIYVSGEGFSLNILDNGVLLSDNIKTKDSRLLSKSFDSSDLDFLRKLKPITSPGS